MRLLRHAVVTVLALLAVALPASATTLDEVAATCPVCTHAFTAFIIRSTNNVGGIDLDFCNHAAGEDPLSVAVWTCPGCRYSNWSQKFAKGVGPETAAWIRQGLEPAAPVAKDAHQLRIPGFVKYGLLVRILEKEGAATGDLAAARRCGAWATRVESWSLVEPARKDPATAAAWEAARKRYAALLEDGPEPSLGGIDGTRAEMRAATTLLSESQDAPAAALFAVGVLRSRGENLPARAALDALVGRESAPSAVRDVARSLVASIEAERGFQEALVRDLTVLLDPAAAGEPGDPEWLRHLRADTLRRLGRAEESRTAFRAVLEHDGTLLLFRMAQRALEDSGGVGIPAERVEELRRRRVDGAIARLLDPKTAERAGQDLRSAADPAAVPRILAALGSEQARVRRSAASALAYVEAPDDALLGALSKVLLEDLEDAAREAAARTLAEFADPRSRDTFVEALQYSDEVRRRALEALGLCGDETVVPELIAVRNKSARNVAAALSMLTNRAPCDSAAFDLWMTANGSKSRDEWVRTGFAEAGLPVPAEPWSKEHVPLLVGWLADARPHVRGNAFRLLKSLSGRRIGRDCLADSYDSPRSLQERRLAVRDWQRWAAEGVRKR